MFTPILDAMILLTVMTPVMGLISRRPKKAKVVKAYAMLAVIFALMLTPLYYYGVLTGDVILVVHGSSPPIGVSIAVDTFSIFMALISLTIGAVTIAFPVGEIEGGNVTGYYTVMLAMTSAMIGIVFSGDLFTLFIFWEIMCISSYTLVAFRKERWEPIEASYKYLIMSATGSMILLFALSFLYGLAGTLNIAYLSMSLAEGVENPWMSIALLMLIVGFGLQAGMVPFHTWLPDAHMAAPSPVSAILSGIMVKTGIYGFIRVLMLIFASMYGSWHITLAAFAVLTMFVGNFMALLQDDIKRLLAFSTIANIGYILLGVSIGSYRAVAGSLFHVLNHAVLKALLFLCAGAFIYRGRTRSLMELAGIRRTMPITGTIFIIGTIALIGFPPLNFFWSELMIVTAALEAGLPYLSLLMIVNVMLSSVYCLRLIQATALKEPTSISKRAKEAPVMMLIPILTLGLLCVLIGAYPVPFQAFAEAAAKAALDQKTYIEAVIPP
ncbi:MAG: proton-conducting transporter membrane subunit [Candidatus Bathyarchaeota archaeon]|nr:proton-conducting transporter membrane subunit [Candidatus Bathyarchaeota archaeon]